MTRMLMVLADGKHFRAGTARLKRVALVFLDDASRYGLDVVVGEARLAETGRAITMETRHGVWRLVADRE